MPFGKARSSATGTTSPFGRTSTTIPGAGSSSGNSKPMLLT